MTTRRQFISDTSMGLLGLAAVPALMGRRPARGWSTTHGIWITCFPSGGAKPTRSDLCDWFE